MKTKGPLTNENGCATTPTDQRFGVLYLKSYQDRLSLKHISPDYCSNRKTMETFTQETILKVT